MSKDYTFEQYTDTLPVIDYEHLLWDCDICYDNPKLDHMTQYEGLTNHIEAFLSGDTPSDEMLEKLKAAMKAKEAAKEASSDDDTSVWIIILIIVGVVVGLGIIIGFIVATSQPKTSNTTKQYTTMRPQYNYQGYN
jgi:hypothetical protein